MGAILGQFGVEVVSPKELGITVDVEETGSTFAENAMLKAKAICELAKLPAIADDSGLCVDASTAAPVCTPPAMAAWTTMWPAIGCCWRISGEPGPVPPTSIRRWCAASPTGTCWSRGRLPRHHRLCPQGENGFGYDSIFVQDGRTFGEMTDEEKDARSHRGRAFAEFEEKLREYLKGKG